MSLWMSISDEIEVATITINEVTILETKATIVLSFQFSLTTSVLRWRQRTLQECTARSEFFFAHFLVSVVVVPSSLVALHAKSAIHDHLICHDFAWKTKDWWKPRYEIDVCGYPHRSSDVCIILCSFPALSWANGFLVSYSFLMLNKEAIN